jgi:DNA-binding CsgD family transcriptional regulator
VADARQTLEAARAAYEQRNWALAREGFRAASEVGLLCADDLAAMGRAAWWLGDVEESNRRLQEANRRYLDDEQQENAASTAIELAINYFLRGDEAMGSGWMGRAVRLVEGAPESPVHGYLAYLMEVEGNFVSADVAGVITAARRVQELGRKFGDLNLVAAGVSGEGRMLIKDGRTSEGLALLDEAMVSVVAGELAPDWAGNIYCNAISICHALGDLHRMRTWTDAAERWLETLPAAVLFAGICRVHRAQLLCLCGEWERAEQEAASVCEDLAGISVSNVAEAWYQVGEVRRLRGDLDAAEQAYRKAHENGLDPQPGLALLRLASGRIDESSAAIRTALIATSDDRLSRSRLYAAQVEIALAAGDKEMARKACDELSVMADTYASSELEALAVTARGIVLLAEGLPERALPSLREACRCWRELNATYAAARTCLWLAEVYRALGDVGAAAMELDAAAAVFSRLGARVDVARVEALRAGPTAPGGLSDREVEVLVLVASGRTNRKIAEALCISEKTVARHLSNIFTKLSVTSRTDAARVAFEHGLVASGRRG